MEFITLIGGLVLIIFGATLLTDGSVALAARFRVPEFIVGLTVVAVGTSMPELAVSFVSALNGSVDMSIGNVVGSNICNVFAILGISAICSPVMYTESNIRRDIPICIAASLALLAVTLFDEQIGRIEGLLLFIGYVSMLFFTIRADRKSIAQESASEETAAVMSPLRIIFYIAIGLVGLIYGGQLCVDGATEIARSFGVSEATIAITLVAGGTSLPELAASLAAMFKGKASMALGNVLGSNIANILLILGVCSMTTPLTMGNVEMSDVYMAVAASVVVLLTAFVLGRNKLTRIEGVIFLGCYVAYVYTLL